MADLERHRLRGRFFGRVFSRVGFLLALGMILVCALTWQITQEWIREYTDAQLSHVAQMAELAVSRRWPYASAESLEDECRTVQRKTGMRLTVIDPRGAVLGDSDKDPAAMENHANRPEVVAALAGHVGTDRRLSASVGRPFVYVAVPLRLEDRVVAVVRVAAPASEIHQQEVTLIKWVATGLGVALPLALLIAWFVSKALARPVQTVGHWARRLATGDLDTRVEVQDDDEIGQVAESLESMRVNLAERIRQGQQQRQDLEVTLGNLEEGVIAVNAQGVVLTLNAVARELLGTEGSLIGWPLTVGLTSGPLANLWSEAVASSNGQLRRQIELDGSVRQSITTEVTEDTEFGSGKNPVFSVPSVAKSPQRRTLDVTITRVADAQSPIAWLLCVRDITELARSAAMKADFVANASHELRTPVAAIQAAVETLRSEDVDEADRGRFMAMIGRHAERLAHLTEDLMHLNRAESTSAGPVAATFKVSDVFASINQSFDDAVRRKSATLRFADLDIEMFSDPRWLELVLKNLVDNAVKFIEYGGCIDVRCRTEQEKVWFEVADDGCGIPAEDIDRVFERFYQVDKSRSLSVGGTGLGLAIVKHAVQALGGEVGIQSGVGRGTTAKFWLPRVMSDRGKSPRMQQQTSLDEATELYSGFETIDI